MKKIILIALILLSAVFMFACNKDGGEGGGESHSVYVTLHNDSTVSGQSFGGATGNSVAVPERAGNTFLGYYTADGVQYFDGTGRQISGLMVADGMQFFAKYEPYKYTIEFNAQSGYFEDNTTEKSVTVSYGDDLSQLIPSVHTLNPKYELDGYYDELGTRRYTNGTVAEFSLDNLGNGETLKLHAKFKVRELTVTLNYNDGVSWNDKITVKYGEKIGDLSAYHKADGDMEIATWSTSHMYEQPLPEAITEDITIFAMWRKYVYVDFMYPGNVIKSQKVYVADGKSCIFPSGDIAGYKLQGWYENAELSGEPVSGIYESNLKSVYYGKWSDARYVITFNTDGGSRIDSVEYAYGDSFKLPDNKKYGYLFLGWEIPGKDGIHTEITSDTWGDLHLNAVYATDYTPIFTETDLKNIANNTAGKYFLVNDITLTEAWTPIPEFSGVLDGNSFAIKNLTLTCNSGIDRGFILTLDGTVRNLNVENVNFSVSFQDGTYPSYPAYGIFARITVNSKVYNCHAKGFKFTYDVAKDPRTHINVGAIAGQNEGLIEQCSSECEIVGITHNFSVVLGGITGNTGSGTVKDCTSRIKCTASADGGHRAFHIGGITGIFGDGEIINSYAITDITLNGGAFAAGLYEYGVAAGAAKITASFTNHTLDRASATSPDYIYNTLGWDKDVWDVTEGEYPRLRALDEEQ